MILDDDMLGEIVEFGDSRDSKQRGVILGVTFANAGFDEVGFRFLLCLSGGGTTEVLARKCTFIEWDLEALIESESKDEVGEDEEENEEEGSEEVDEDEEEEEEEEEEGDGL